MHLIFELYREMADHGGWKKSKKSLQSLDKNESVNWSKLVSSMKSWVYMDQTASLLLNYSNSKE